MATNRELLSKSIKYLTGALPLLFIGPVVIHNAFMNQKNDLYYLVLGIGLVLCIVAVYLMVLGLKTMVKSLFND